MPKIIKENGNTPIFEIISGEKFKKSLKAKLLEEALEVEDSKTNENLLEELADVYQVIIDLAKEYQFSLNDVKNKALQKRKERGSFKKGIFLIKVE